jgi:multicomponent Na+:H+ antiporter subunit E
MKSRIALFVLGFAVWLVLTWPPGARSLVLGVLASLSAALLTGDMFVRRPYMLKDPRRYAYFALYVPLFIWECIKANLQVAYLVSHPDMPIRPGIVKVKTRLKSDTGLTFLANTITLPPGTMTVDIDRDGGFLYIHWINVMETDADAATRRIVDVFERILIRIFE